MVESWWYLLRMVHCPKHLRKLCHFRNVSRGYWYSIAGVRIWQLEDVGWEEMDSACVLVLVELVAVIYELLAEVAAHDIRSWVSICYEPPHISSH